MIRFSIRDLIWLTIVAAVFSAWFIHHRQESACYDRLKAELTKTQEFWGRVAYEADQNKLIAADAVSQAQSSMKLIHDLERQHPEMISHRLRDLQNSPGRDSP